MTLSQPSAIPQDQRKIADILFVEDSLADVALIKAILKVNKINFSFHFLRDGEEAINLLNSDDPIVNELDLIFVDFNFPKSSGFEVLNFVKSHPTLKDVPVIMLSGHYKSEDMNEASELGANNYIVKPLSEDKFEKAIENISTLEFVRQADQKHIYVVPSKT